MIVKDFIFFDNSTGTSPVCVNEDGASDTVTFSVISTGSPSVVVEGRVDLTSSEWMQLTCFSLKDPKGYNTITAQGMYQAPITGVKEVRMTNSGSSANVSGTLVNSYASR